MHQTKHLNYFPPCLAITCHEFPYTKISVSSGLAAVPIPCRARGCRREPAVSKKKRLRGAGRGLRTRWAHAPGGAMANRNHPGTLPPRSASKKVIVGKMPGPVDRRSNPIGGRPGVVLRSGRGGRSQGAPSGSGPIRCSRVEQDERQTEYGRNAPHAPRHRHDGPDYDKAGMAARAQFPRLYQRDRPDSP